MRLFLRLVPLGIFGVMLAVPAAARAQASLRRSRPAGETAAQAAQVRLRLRTRLFDETPCCAPVLRRRPPQQHRRRSGPIPALRRFQGRRGLHERALGETAGKWNYQFTADNTGYRDQRYYGAYERVGRFRIWGLWDEIPQFYSVDTMTPFTTATDGALVLNDATQQAGEHHRLRFTGAAVRSARAPGHRHGEHVRDASTTSTCARRLRARATSASCPGARASGSATTWKWRALRLAHERHQPGRRVEQHPADAARRVQDRGSRTTTLIWDSPLVLPTRRTVPPGVAAWRSGRRTRRRR